MTRRLISVLVALIIVLGGAYACVYEVFKVTSTETVLTEVASPDGDWKALEYERFYDGPFPFMTDIVAGVRLISMRDSALSADVMSVSAHGADEEPRIVWTAPRTLQVQVSTSMFLKVLTCEFDGVRIDIRLPPDDAANRAAWYRQLGKPDPDPGGVLARKCP
jgi:hypothetical protein